MRSAFCLAAIASLVLVFSCTRTSLPGPSQTAQPTGTARPVPGVTPTPAPTIPVVVNRGGKYGGTLVFANRGDPPSGFDPLQTSSIALHHVAGALDGPGNLVMRCRQNMYLVCPNLATSWVSNPGFTEWTFTIRDDAFWHDGARFTAEDARFWFDLAYSGSEVGGKVRAPAYFKSDLGDIEKVEVLEFNRLRITFRERNPHFLSILADPRYKIAHPTHLLKDRIEKGEVGVSLVDIGLVGIGPFKLDRYERGSVIRVRRFDQYWEKNGEGNKLPYLAGIDYVIMPDPLTMDVAFRAGRLDGGARGEGHYLTAERMQGYVRDLREDVFFARWEGGTLRLAFNVLRPGPWQDPQVRRAIALWIDKRAAIPSALGGFGWTSPDLVPPDIPLPEIRRSLINWPRFDPEPLEERRAKARGLMVEAGYAKGFPMGHLCRALSTAPCEFLKAQLSGLGVDLRLQMVDEGEWNRARVTLDYDSQQGRLTPSPIPEGTESVYGRYSQNADAYAKHEDSMVDELYRRLKNVLSQQQRVEVWREIERYLFVEQTYIIPIAESTNVVPYRTYVKGLTMPTEDGHTHTDFATVWLDKR